MPLPMMGAAAGAMGMQQNKQKQQKNKFQQVRDQASAMNPQQGAGIGPSPNAMGGMMGAMGKAMPGRRMGQAMGRANPMGQMAGAMGQAGGGLGQMAGQALGGFQQQRALKQKQNFMPRQDMGAMPDIGMSSAVLPNQQPMEQVPEMAQQFGSSMEQPAPLPPEPMQQSPQRIMGRTRGGGPLGRGGIGPRFM